MIVLSLYYLRVWKWTRIYTIVGAENLCRDTDSNR